MNLRSLARTLGGAVLIAATAVAGSACSGEDNTPVGVVRDWLRAAAEGRTDRVYQLLAPESQRWLSELTKLATVQTGSRARFKPDDLMAATAGRSRHELSDVHLVKQSADHATVELVGEREDVRERIKLTRVDDRWRVILPRPPGTR